MVKGIPSDYRVMTQSACPDTAESHTSNHPTLDMGVEQVERKEYGGKPRKFNVEREIQYLTSRGKNILQNELSIFTLNTGGLRTPYKKESLRELTRQLALSVGIITETHLLDSEAAELQIPGYQVLDRMGNSKHRGGVLILVDTNKSVRKLDEIQALGHQIDACSFLLCPTHEEDCAIQITGVYIPPSSHATPEMLRPLAEDRQCSVNGQDSLLSHLIVGDLNPNCWEGDSDEKYKEWLLEAGIWELSDPAVATLKTGSSLDKFLLQPGADAPEELLSPSLPTGDVSRRGKEAEDEEDFPFPAVVFLRPWVEAHHPVLLGIKVASISSTEAQPKEVRNLKVSDLKEEDWISKHCEMAEYLQKNSEAMNKAIKGGNPTRLLDIPQQGLYAIFKKQFRRKQTPERGKGQSSFQKFCKRHLSHPEYPVLVNAILEYDLPTATAVMRQMSRKKWHEYLAKTSPTDTRAIFRYLAKEDGRKPRAAKFSRSAPIKDTSGVRKFTNTDKCRILADFFEQKPKSPAPLDDPHLRVQSLSEKRRTPSHGGKKRRRSTATRGEKLMGTPGEPFVDFSVVEVREALYSLAEGKAAGPDGLVVEVYQNLPCVIEPLAELFSIILKVGGLPLSMLKLTIAPLDKPNKDPEECGSKRPISLLNVLSKTLEAAILHRIMQEIESTLAERQYAYKRHRGTEAQLTEFHDFVREAVAANHSVYAASVDVDSAFDAVPHALLVQTAKEMNVDPYICRYLQTWLTDRIFTVRLQTPQGKWHSTWRRIGRGVPQGGVLSPFLWLMHMNTLIRDVHSDRSNLPDYLGAV